MVKILVVEDEGITAKDLQVRLQHMGYEVPRIVATGEGAIDSAIELKPDLLLMDIMLQGEIDGIEAARQIRRSCDIPVIYLSAYTDEMMSERAKSTEPFGYLSKPFSNNDLQSTIEVALFKHTVEKKLRNEIKFTEQAIDAQLDTFFVFDPQTGKAIRWNKRFREVSGYSDEEISLMKAPDAYFGQDDLEKAREVIRHVLQGGHGRVEVSLVCKDGTHVPTEYVASAFTDEENHLRYIISIGRDMSERKEVERKLIYANKEWEVTFDSINDLVSIHDRDFNLVKVNRAFCDFLKLPREAIIGKKCYEVLHCSDKPWPDCPHEKTMNEKIPNTHEFYEPKLAIHVQVSTSPIFDEKGEITGTVHIVKDVSFRYKA